MASLLIVTVFLPLVGTAALLLAPQLDARRSRSVALGLVLATTALSLVLLAGFDKSARGPQFACGSAESGYGVEWMRGLGVRFALGLDGASLWLFVLTSVLMITSVFASWESIRERAPAHYALMLALHTGLLGLFASLDVVLFYIFFEFTLIPLFFLIGIWGGPDRRRASITFFLYTLAGSLLTLVGVIALVAVHAQHGGQLTFSIPELTTGLAELRGRWPQWYDANSLSSPQVLIFLLLFAGFAIKVPMFPFHTWLPLAHVEAPTAGSILLAGVLLKVGGYGLYRFNLGMTPLGADYLWPLLAALSVAGILYGALTALAQTDVKKLVAYSSVSHMGFIVLGLFSLTPTGIDGAMIQMINHGVTTGALFACVGVFYERYHTREMAELGGLWNWSPTWAFFIILASLGSAAVPFLNGFVGEFPILVGAFSRSPLVGTLAALGMILGAYYLFTMLRRICFGPLREPAVHGHGHGHAVAATLPPLSGGSDDHVDHADHGGHGHDAHGHAPTARPIGWHEVAGLTPLMALIVLIGVWPSPFFDRMRPSVASTVATIGDEQDAARERPARLAPAASNPPPPGDVSRVRGANVPGLPQSKEGRPRAGAGGPPQQKKKANVPSAGQPSTKIGPEGQPK
jgi:NADH-quinone oxidoreductase subunit M